jgi:SAM-dependent methyltransferase
MSGCDGHGHDHGHDHGHGHDHSHDHGHGHGHDHGHGHGGGDDTFFDDHARDWDSPSLVALAATNTALVRGMVGDARLRGAAAVDYGCGTAQYALGIAEICGSVLAVDPAGEMVKVAREFRGPRCSIFFFFCL